jgi:hypothetical protein
MKQLMLAVFLLAGFIQQDSKAQVKVNLNVNIGKQPVWGPVGYDHADFYYLPDIDCYYDINMQQFVYFEGGQWIYAAALPPRFGHVDLYNTYKVVVNQPKPFLHADVYRQKYARYKGYKQKQPIIRDSKQEKYFEVKDHPQHATWVQKHPDRDHH